jgi:hypothetical protein
MSEQEQTPREWKLIVDDCDRISVPGGWIYRTWETRPHPDCTIGWKAPQRVQLCAVFVPRPEGWEP